MTKSDISSPVVESPPKKAKIKPSKALAQAQMPSTVEAGRDDEGDTIPHERNEITSEKVTQYARCGATENEIAVMLDIRPGQLRKHYARELEVATLEANMSVGEVIYGVASSGKDMDISKFWATHRMGWTNKDAGKDTSPLLINIHL